MVIVIGIAIILVLFLLFKMRDNRVENKGPTTAESPKENPYTKTVEKLENLFTMKGSEAIR